MTTATRRTWRDQPSMTNYVTVGLEQPTYRNVHQFVNASYGRHLTIRGFVNEAVRRELGRQARLGEQSSINPLNA